jgi:hypothetical protein
MSATSFKAVVWKELRENLNWAVLILLGMAAMLIYAIPSLDDMLRGQGLNLNVNLNGIINALGAITMIGGLLAGLLIGVAQTLVENRGDKWGFLAHRPISRTTLFWGKATAGVLLYAISTGVPVAAALLWVASPGYLPIPFDWSIALPAIANLLCGLVFYVAGFLTGMRQARWYASRTLGIGAAICVAILQGAVATEFWQAIAASAAGLILVGTAAWSTFVAGGQYDAQPLVGRIATGASIGLGVALVGVLVLAASLNVLPGPVVSGPVVVGLNQELFYTYYRITTDGVVVRITRSKDNKILEISDPDGRPLERYRNLAPDQHLSAGVVSAHLSPRILAPVSFRSTDQPFSQLRRAEGSNPVGWYYMHRQGLLAAYDSESWKLIGWMGPDGFSPGEVKPRPFAGRLVRSLSSDSGQPLMVFEDAVYRMNLNKHSVELVFQAEPAETILNLGMPQSRAPAFAELGEMARFEVIATTRRVIVQLRDGTRVLEAPQDASASKYRDLQVSRALRAPGVPTFLWYHSILGDDNRISEFNSVGAVVNSWTLPGTTSLWRESLPQIAISVAMFPLINRPSLETIGQTEWHRFASSLFRLSGPPEIARWALAILFSLMSAAAAVLHGRRYAFPAGRLIAWTVIALLLGPLGYLLMLALIEWPARESCPACNRKRVVTREYCEHCGEPFAAPPKDGTEIFAPELGPAGALNAG